MRKIEKVKLNNKNLVNILVIITTVFIMLVILESGLRLFYPQLTSTEVLKRAKTLAIFEPSEYYVLSMIPNIEVTHLGAAGDFEVNVKINSLGLRDKEFDDSKSSILIVGDSFTFGYGVEHNETYTEVLESLLNNRSIQVINAGFGGGYGPDAQYLFMKKNIDYFNPRVVILGYLVANDIINPLTNKWIIDDDGEIEKVISTRLYSDDKLRVVKKFKEGGEEIGSVPLKNRLLSEIHSFSAAHFHSYVLFKNFILNILKDKLNSLIEHSIESSPYDKVYDKQYKKGWAISKEMIMKMNNLSKERNIHFIIMIIPSKIQVQDWQTFKKTYDKEVIRSKPNLLLMALAKREEIPAIDLLPRFDELNTQCSNCPYFFKNDPHWNREGHKVAAEELYKFITKNKRLNKALLQEESEIT